MEHGKSFPLGPGEGHAWAEVSIAEIVYTFVLCFVVLNVATLKENHMSHYFGLAIASCVTAGNGEAEVVRHMILLERRDVEDNEAQHKRIDDLGDRHLRPSMALTWAQREGLSVLH